MRFYIQATDQGVTTCINFDHVTTIRVTAKTIELSFVGIETPMVMTKTVENLTLVSKGMDLSDSSKEMLCRL